MKILTADQILSADEFTIKNEPVSSIQLMERAASSCTDWIVQNCKNHTKFAVFCGSGNNGGDGLAMARILYLKGFGIEVFMNKENKNFSDDAQINFEKVKEISGITVRSFDEAAGAGFDDQTIIIDAIFGTGLSRKPEGIYKKVIEDLNVRNSVKISVDVPSGLFCDTISETEGTVFKADYTLSFQFWKRSFLHPETGQFVGKVIILDINLNKNYISQVKTDYFAIDDQMVTEIFKPREDFAHKGMYGKVIIAAGSYGKMGAAVLAVKSALKTGCGLTFVLAPTCGYEILQTSCPEAMFLAGGDININHVEFQKGTVYGIGPGLGTYLETEKALVKFLKIYPEPLILDADALNILSGSENNLKLIPDGSIITPHPKEFERLFGITENSYKRLELAREKAKEYKIYIVLKDHHTQIVTPQGKVFYNIIGNSGLAKGGSGDVLTGILTSLLAQGYSEESACLLGVWIHGKAADFAAEQLSKESMLPTHVISEIGNVFLDLNKKVTTEL